MIKKLNECKQKVIDEEFCKPFDDSVALIGEVKGPMQLKKVQFINFRYPGQSLSFFYHSGTLRKQTYTLFDGVTYQLPEEIVEHVNNLSETVYKQAPSFHEAIQEFSVRGVNETHPLQSAGKKYLYQLRPVHPGDTSW